MSAAKRSLALICMKKTEYEYLRKTARWLRLRKTHLAGEPLCRMCRSQGYITPANVVDHIVAHKGDVNLFYDQHNLQTLCKEHHDSTKHAEESGGRILGCNREGVPIDPLHHWSPLGG